MSLVASGYVKAMKASPTGAPLRATEKAVLMSLADAHHEESQEIEASMTWLAQDTLLSVNTVAAIVKRLIAKGCLTVERRNDERYGHQPNRYRLVGCPARPRPTTHRGATPKTGVAPSPVSGVGGPPKSGEASPKSGVAPSPVSGDPLKTPDPDLPLRSSLSRNPEQECLAQAASPKAGSAACGSGTDWFAEFWRVAEGRNGKRPLYRGKAEEYFRKFVPVELQPACVEAYRRYLKHCREHDRETCDPFRFIKGQKGELWREFLPPPNSPSRGAQPGRQAMSAAQADGRAGSGRPAPVAGEPPPEGFQALLEKVRNGAAVKSMPGGR